MSNEALVHLIDDDDAVRDSLAFTLDSAGFGARTYASAEDFLAVQGDVAAGCIVTDIRMPAMNGLELLRELRRRGSTLPVVVITGHGDVPLAVEAMRAGSSPGMSEIISDSTRAGQAAAAS